MDGPHFESEQKQLSQGLTRSESFDELIDVELAQGVVLRPGGDDVTTHGEVESLFRHTCVALASPNY